MARGPGALKRQKELARLEWQREKAERRKQRKREKEARERRGEAGTPFGESAPQAAAARYPSPAPPSAHSAGEG